MRTVALFRRDNVPEWQDDGRSIGSLNGLRAGDVLLLKDGGGFFREPTHMGITFGQSTLSHQLGSSSNTTHAGIYDGTAYILEASGAAGCRSAQLVTKNNYRYQVWRYSRSKRIPAYAKDVAEQIIHTRQAVNPGQANYSLGPHLGGLLRYSGRGEGARQAVANLMNDVTAIQQWYCSSFVVACYEVAREMRGFQTPVIDVDFRFVSPKRLQAALREAGSGWEHVGDYKFTGG
jgi:hypothetical protein